MEKTSKNSTLNAAKATKNDEFYTQFRDIQNEIESYIDFNKNTFKNKTVYCNCDDPFESHFFKYFALKFNQLKLKKLISTSYEGSPIAGEQVLLPEYNKLSKQRKGIAVILDNIKDANINRVIDDIDYFLQKATRKQLKPDDKYISGDFRSQDCVNLFKQADIIVTNPPFSLFREYVAQIMNSGKRFLILGSVNAITYKEIFPLIKSNKIWLGVKNGAKIYRVPDYYKQNNIFTDNDGYHYAKMGNTCWFTNLDHGRRHEKLPLMTMADNLKFSKHKEIRGKANYDRYDNYDAIDVPFTDAIPIDYDGAMGVPITFLDKYNPEQFEIVGIDRPLVYALTGKVSRFRINGKEIYARIIIRHRQY